MKKLIVSALVFSGVYAIANLSLPRLSSVAGRPPTDPTPKSLRASSRQSSQGDVFRLHEQLATPDQHEETRINRLLAEADRYPAENPERHGEHAWGRETAVQVTEVLGEWAGKEPRAALRWISNHPTPDSALMEAHVLATWADREPAAAASWVKDIPGKSSPANLMAVLGAWTDTDQASAMDWYLKELDSTQRQSIFADMLVTARERELVQRLLENIDPVAADDGLNAASRSLQDCDPDMSRMLAEFLRKPMMGREQDTLEFSDKDFAPIEDPVPSEISESTAEPTLPES